MKKLIERINNIKNEKNAIILAHSYQNIEIDMVADFVGDSLYLSQKAKERAIEKLKMAAVLQYTLPGVPCIYYGDENAQEGDIDPFCRRCYDWNNQNIDLIDFYAKLGAIRKEFREIFKDGDFVELTTKDGLVYFKRENQAGSIYVYANNSSKRERLQFTGTMRELIKNQTFENELEILPYSYGIFVKF